MYVVLSLYCSSVSSNIFFMDFNLVANVKSVVEDFVLFMFTHQSCVQLDKMLVAFWSCILAILVYSSVIHLHTLRTSLGMEIS